MTEAIAVVPDDQSLSRRLKQLELCLARVGWEICHFEMDLSGGSLVADIRVAGSDGKWLLARIDRSGRCSLERFVRTRQLSMARDTKGRRPLSPQVDDVFLGRQWLPSPAALLEQVGEYVANHPAAPAHLEGLRAAWRALLAPGFSESHETTEPMYATPVGREEGLSRNTARS